MKNTIDGKRYDTDKCEALAEFDHYMERSNNHSGTTRLMLASDGVYLLWTDSNGQNCWMRDSLSLCGNPTKWLNGVKLTDEEEARLFELSLIDAVTQPS